MHTKKPTNKQVFSSTFRWEIATFVHFQFQVGMCNQPFIHWEEVSRSWFRGWSWLLMCHASSAHRGFRCGLESITEASSQAVAWPLLMAYSTTAEAKELALLKACAPWGSAWDKVLLVCPKVGDRAVTAGNRVNHSCSVLQCNRVLDTSQDVP